MTRRQYLTRSHAAAWAAVACFAIATVAFVVGGDWIPAVLSATAALGNAATAACLYIAREEAPDD